MAKVKKKTDDIEKLTHIKEYFEQQVILKGICDNVVSEYVSDDGEGCECFDCTADCKGYTLHIKFQMLISSINIEFNFSYSGNDIKFSLDDVLNVLDINDFNEYFFDADAENERSQEEAIDDVLSLIDKYDYDIRKAGEDTYFPRMCDMHNEDEALFNSDKVKIRDILKLSSLEVKLRKSKSEKDKNAYIKFVEKQEQKVGIENKTKRFVEYLKLGYDVPDSQEVYENTLKYDKTALLCYVICDVIGLIVAFAIFIADHTAISQKGIITVGFIEYLFTAVSGLCFGYVLSRIFGTKIILVLTPSENRDSALKSRKNRFDDLDFFEKIFAKYIAPVLAAVVMIFCTLLACSGVCVTDNSVIDHNLIGDTEYKYEDVTVYLSKGYWEDDEYYEYDYPCYVFDAGNEITVETGEIRKEEHQKAIKNVLNKNGIKPQIIDKNSQKPKE